MDRTLWGGNVQRLSVARLGMRDIVLIQVRVPGETVHVLVAGGHGVGVVGEASRQSLRDAIHGFTLPQQTVWRAQLEGASVVGVGERSVDIQHEGRRWRAACGGGDTVVLVSAPPPPLEAPPTGAVEGPSWTVLIERGARFAAELVQGATGGRLDALRRALTAAKRRIDRRIQAIGGDLDKMAVAEDSAQKAKLFVAEAATAPRGATCLRTVDWSNGEPVDVAMTLDPAKSAREQVAAIFKRARRLKDGAKIARSRLAEAQGTRVALDLVGAALENEQAPSPAALEAAARRAAPRDFKMAKGVGAGPGPRQGRSRRDVARPPYRRFVGASGQFILVGRGALQNDALTLHVARPRDLWLHAKNQAGAHVVVPLEKDRVCPPDLLVEAAHLAAHFSEARDEPVVEVQYTPRRYVRKPRASAPGAVRVEREKVIVLRKEDDILRRLLDSETETDG